MKMRYLQGNKGTTLPAEVCFLGVAGRREQAKGDPDHATVLLDSYLAHFVRLEDGQQTRASELYNCNPSVFWSYIDARMARHHSLSVYAYDATTAATLLGAWQQLDRGLYARGTIIDADPPIVINLLGLTGRLSFIDVRNFFNMPIGELAASFRVTMPPETLWGINEGKPYYEAKYNEQVAEKSILALMQFVRSHDLGRFKSTISLQALQAFRHRFAPRDTKCTLGDPCQSTLAPTIRRRIYPLAHDSKDIKDFERSANYGGHDECFFIGRVEPEGSFFGHKGVPDYSRDDAYLYGPIYYVDCNSLYPYVMKWAKYPKKYTGERNDETIDGLGRKLDKYCVIARVLIDSPSDVYPVRTKTRTLYATGKFWTTLCGQELEHAWRSGSIVKVGYHVCYEPMDLFSKYVDYFFALKQSYRAEGNEAMALIAKAFLNHLQGKFSQRPKKWVERPDVKPRSRWGKWLYMDYDKGTVQYFRSLAGQVQEEIHDNDVGYSLPAIGAFVTANARNHMAGIRSLLPNRSVLYQGTDSLLLTEQGFSVLQSAGHISSEALGGFRLKGVYDHALIRNAQDYELGGARTTRGLPSDAKVVSGSSYTFDVRQSLAGMLFECPAQRITYAHVGRCFDAAYKGGRVGKDGWVIPFELNYQEDRGDAWEAGDVAELQAAYAQECIQEQADFD